ncbi:DUF4136 domain-containing protein [Fulvivirgaceae bacterium PWU4]|uniref:DUF4136 domain-containing protein n=1 Tax=Chryseosolibacter histidini TaxID=2782349 RepID=A0AAP2GJ17_9BACT|nr:DUF4136 domain-containing protein [Chryseosolibacter histidini]MBT1697866.1 DUF4136 domain-containing protein [Chryseosolibacter histidini]
MRKKGLVTGLLVMVSVVVVNAQRITVASDKAADTDFSKFKTFYWTSQVDNQLDEGYNFLNDLILKAQVRDAVKAELMGLGYKLNPDSPDLLVNFRVFDKPVRLRGTEGYGTSYWGNDQYRSISDTTSYAVEAGTLLISLVDRKEGAIVWQGFASGLIDNNQFIKDEGKIREAVNMIFDEYGLRAKEYSRK